MRKTGMMLSCLAMLSAVWAEPLEVRVRQTAGGPRVFVDGKAVRPRFYYGSPSCLCPISGIKPKVYEIPFRAEVDTDRGQLAIDGYAGDDPMWFSDLRLVDMDSGVTNVITGAAEERTQHYHKDGISFRKGRLYRFLVTHRATHFRTYFRDEVSYLTEDGKKVVLPLPYGDTLNETAALAAEAGVDLVTFSTDTSWGCEGWWGETDDEESYRKLDLACEKLIKANPRVLLIPRLKADAPEWLLARHPELRMKFANGMTVKMSSVSSRFYRREACRQVERVARHLRTKFPRNFAGLHVGGQNSAEWFYMMSQSKDASGYDDATREAFRTWLVARGEPDAASAEVPGEDARRAGNENGLRDPVKDRDAILFHRFRQEEMASFLSELGAAIRRGTDGKVLALFFYGYSWELGAVTLGAPETGHYGLEWLLRHGKENVDGLSAPISYSNRRWPATAPVMSAAETIQRAGILWINEDDNRTHYEDIWDHMSWASDQTPWQTRNNFLRDSAVQILRGYGDWWMDLFGRGWFRDRAVWDVRRALNAMDDAMLRRSSPYTPEIAVCVNEGSFLYCAADSHKVTMPALNRRGFEACGVTYGQYLLNDILTNPPPAKVFYLAVANNLTPEQERKLAELKAARPDAVFVENVRAADVTAEAIAANAAKAGAHAYTQPGEAYVTAAEGYVSVYALKDGPLSVDFAGVGPVVDYLTNMEVGTGPKLMLPFRKGETRIFHVTDAPPQRIFDETEAQREARLRWWTDARFGMFIHFGLYALPARHEWVRSRERIDAETYDKKYFSRFDPDLFDAKEWARAAKAAGMKYAVLTTKHHEGFCLWDTQTTDYKVTRTPFGRDLVREFVDAFRAEGIRVGFYYSIIDWHHSDYSLDETHPAFCREFDRYGDSDKPRFMKWLVDQNARRDMSRYRAYMFRQVEELLTDYGKIDLMWFDFTPQGSGEPAYGKTWKDWDAVELLRMARRLQPQLIVDNRLDLMETDDGWDFVTPEQFKVQCAPTVRERTVPWETCQTFSGSWGYSRDETSWKSPAQLLSLLAETVSFGGNLILNVGPTGRGEFDGRATVRLSAMGRWMRWNARSICGCGAAPADFEPPPGTVLTYNGRTRRLYIHLLQYPMGFLPTAFFDRIDYAQFLHDASELKLRPARQRHKQAGHQAKNDGGIVLPVLKPAVENPVIEVFLK